MEFFERSFKTINKIRQKRVLNGAHLETVGTPTFSFVSWCIVFKFQRTILTDFPFINVFQKENGPGNVVASSMDRSTQ